MGYVGRCPATGAEADAGRASLPSHSEDVPRSGRQDYWHVAGDRQLRSRPHVGGPGLSEGQGGGSRVGAAGAPGQDRRQEVNLSRMRTLVHGGG